MVACLLVSFIKAEFSNEEDMRNSFSGNNETKTRNWEFTLYCSSISDRHNGQRAVSSEGSENAHLPLKLHRRRFTAVKYGITVAFRPSNFFFFTAIS